MQRDQHPDPEPTDSIRTDRDLPADTDRNLLAALRLSYQIPDRVLAEFDPDDRGVLHCNHGVVVTEDDAHHRWLGTDCDRNQPGYRCDCGDTFPTIHHARAHIQRVVALRRRQMAVPESNPVTLGPPTEYPRDNFDTSVRIRPSKPFVIDGSFVYPAMVGIVVGDATDAISKRLADQTGVPADYDLTDWPETDPDGTYHTGIELVTDEGEQVEKQLHPDLFEAGLRVLTDGEAYDPAEYTLVTLRADAPFVLRGPFDTVILAPDVA